MRHRAVVALAILLLPSVAEAQRLPRIGGTRGVPRSVPLGPQPAIVNQALAYNRMRASFESYPFVSFNNTGSFGDNGQSEWASMGFGSRIDYRVARALSLTFDVTSSFLGGPVFTESAELGIRVGPRRSERSLYPFADVRYGYFMTLNGFGSRGDVGGITTGSSNFINYSQGLGGVFGAGLEMTLTRRFSLTGGMTMARSNMTAIRSEPSVGDKYTLTSRRYVLAVRFNGVNYMNAVNNPTGR